jgi:hypothetical protein
MMISYSEARQFRNQCQRKWYFKNVLASWNSKDPMRREAFVLSKLQSLSAWRGSVVDKIVSTAVIDQLRRHDPPSIDRVIDAARRVFVDQRDFALAHRVREVGIRISSHGDAFAAWHDVEYGSPPDADSLDRAWADIELALRNALGSTGLIADLRRGKIVAQARLHRDFGFFKVSANPDAIVFQPERTLRIIDWKVHAFGLRAAKQQLAVYAGVLHRGESLAFFPFDPRSVPLDRIVLTEVQLLNNEVHDYTVTDDEIDDAFDELFDTAEQIRCARGDDDGDYQHVGGFAATPWVEQCERCSFNKICKDTKA